ncbi:glycosyltransferase family 39 protein [Streptomyces gobiensis]|uniref:glycosyltransferase family 39 protein n=1 Tax=Streptomyces gobiensis TaxID=2875706 RepID=UPI001E640D6D|nr:glycosyltransferase family 39 protein [Streptomyces gobiensis]UGY90955.1 glycosyltransferase family 39 protein [Streptomyces gobiensis]
MPYDQEPPQLATVHGRAPAATARRPVRTMSVSRGRFPPLRRSGRIALVFALATGFLTHGYHLFKYPLYLTDEGIYMQRAWAVVRETSLSPYTYDYDHAPGGWLTLAGWAFPLPRQFETFGNAINTGRFLMLLVHIATVYLLFEITRRLSGRVLAASVAAFLYNVSPLAIYFQRQVLLDNLMMFWALLSVFVLLRRECRIKHALAAGLAFGIALITKENAVFFVPTCAYLLHRRIRDSAPKRFAQTLWPFALMAPVGAYVTYAMLKSELIPSGLNFNLENPPADHVSLLYTLWWQINRSQGTLLTSDGLLFASWLPKDGILLLAGVIAMVIALYWGARDRDRNLGFLVAGTLALAYAFYLIRGSVVLDFYVAPLIPLLAMNVGMVTGRLLRRTPSMVRMGLPGLAGAVLLLAPATGYLLTINTEGRVEIADQYNPRLNLTGMQEKQIAWIRKNVPPDAKIIMDDDLWSELHDVKPFYPLAHSHWNAASDPDVRDKLFGKKWKNIDYIIMSNKMRESIAENNAGGQEDWILAALKNSEKVWETSQGDIKLEIYRVK